MNIDASLIMSQEHKLLLKATKRLENMPNLILLGPWNVAKLPIISFVIKCPSFFGHGLLHHNFVCTVLNDVFGIQSRGGCACAGNFLSCLNLIGGKFLFNNQF